HFPYAVTIAIGWLSIEPRSSRKTGALSAKGFRKRKKPSPHAAENFFTAAEHGKNVTLSTTRCTPCVRSRTPASTPEGRQTALPPPNSALGRGRMRPSLLLLHERRNLLCTHE